MLIRKFFFYHCSTGSMQPCNSGNMSVTINFVIVMFNPLKGYINKEILLFLSVV